MQPWRGFWFRWGITLAAGLVTFVACSLTPLVWDSAFLIAWDISILTWLFQVYLKVRRTDALGTYQQAQAVEPITPYVLLAVILTAAVGLVAAVALATHHPERGQLSQGVHFGAGVLAILLAWVFLHTEFALYYARLYYDEDDSAAARSAGNPTSMAAIRKGLVFPEGEAVDYWAFIFYSFTVAMSYQSPGVTVIGLGMRRVTVLHAAVSFFFTIVILGYTVSVIGQAL